MSELLAFLQIVRKVKKGGINFLSDVLETQVHFCLSHSTVIAELYSCKRYNVYIQDTESQMFFLSPVSSLVIQGYDFLAN